MSGTGAIPILNAQNGINPNGTVPDGLLVDYDNALEVVLTTGGVIPTGGALGQALVKNSAADNDIVWQYPAIWGTNAQLSNYTLVATDAGKIISITNAIGKTLTIPSNANVPFPIGQMVRVVQGGAGSVTVAGDIGVTVNSQSGSTILAAASAEALLVKLGTDTWLFTQGAQGAQGANGAQGAAGANGAQGAAGANGAQGAQGSPGNAANIPQNTQTASYQIALSDVGEVVEMNVGSANNLTVPANATTAFAIGDTVEIFQLGAGQTTIVAAGGVTVDAPGAGLKIASQFGTCTLRKRATNEWVAAGYLTA